MNIFQCDLKTEIAVQIRHRYIWKGNKFVREVQNLNNKWIYNFGSPIMIGDEFVIDFSIGSKPILSLNNRRKVEK